MAVLSRQTILACFAVAFWTQASTRFVTGELHWEKKMREMSKERTCVASENGTTN